MGQEGVEPAMFVLLWDKLYGSLPVMSLFLMSKLQIRGAYCNLEAQHKIFPFIMHSKLDAYMVLVKNGASANGRRQ